jgi:hypothetical protein
MVGAVDGWIGGDSGRWQVGEMDGQVEPLVERKKDREIDG